MNKEQMLKILQAVIFFSGGDTKLYIKNVLGLSEPEVILASKLFRYLKFYPSDKLKEEIKDNKPKSEGGLNNGKEKTNKKT